MKILVDENIPRMTVDGLRELGHNVKDIRGTVDQGSSDRELWEIAVAEHRLLITTGKGFTEYRGVEHAGILIVRLRQARHDDQHVARGPEARLTSLVPARRHGARPVALPSPA